MTVVRIRSRVRVRVSVSVSVSVRVRVEWLSSHPYLATVGLRILLRLEYPHHQHHTFHDKDGSRRKSNGVCLP